MPYRSPRDHALRLEISIKFCFQEDLLQLMNLNCDYCQVYLSLLVQDVGFRLKDIEFRDFHLKQSLPKESLPKISYLADEMKPEKFFLNFMREV